MTICRNRQISLLTRLEKHMAAAKTHGCCKFLFLLLLKNFFTSGLFWLCCLFNKLHLVRQSNFGTALANHQLFRNTLQWKEYFLMKFVIHVSSYSLSAHAFSNKYVFTSKTTFEHKMKNKKYISGRSDEQSVIGRVQPFLCCSWTFGNRIHSYSK